MRTKIIAAVAGLLLTVGASIALPVEPASAHNFDNYSTFFCAAHRPSNTVLAHSWPYYMASGEVGYWCKADFYGVSHQYWVHWYQDSGTSVRPWPYQKCKPAQGGIVWCGTAGH